MQKSKYILSDFAYLNSMDLNLGNGDSPMRQIMANAHTVGTIK